MQRVPAPVFIEPMMAKPMATLPVGPDWMYEVKWDGYRLLIAKDGDRVTLTSRKENDLTKTYPEIVDAARTLKVREALIDGELVALDADGKPSFQALQNRASRHPKLVFYAFDLLRLNGKPTLDEPLEARKKKLEAILSGSSLKFSSSLVGEPSEILANVAALGLEGVVAKRRDSRYEPGERSGHWQKVKLSPEQEFVVGGFKPAPRGIDALIVGYYAGKKLLCAGTVRQGLNPRNRQQLGELLKPLQMPECPFANLPNSKTSHWGEGITAEKMLECRWVEPTVVAQISFVEWTEGLNLRHATYKGLRDDKRAKDVRKET